LGTHEEAVEDSVASVSKSDKRARAESSDIKREVEELPQDASQANLEDAADAERSMLEAKEELIDKAIYGCRTERIRNVFFEFFATQIKEKKWALNKRMPRAFLRHEEFDELRSH
jgi:hypothetical protein